MTTTAHQPVAPTTASRTPLLVALSLGSAALLTAVGTFLDLTGNEPSSRNDLGEVGGWLVCLVISVVAAAVAFGVVLRGAPTGHAGRRCLVTAVVGVLSVAVFWTGIPSVLVAAAVGCALVDRDRQGRFGASSVVGLALAAVAYAGAVSCAIAG